SPRSRAIACTAPTTTPGTRRTSSRPSWAPSRAFEAEPPEAGEPGSARPPGPLVRRPPPMCGFVGITGIDPVAPALFLGLQAVQHRGQDAAGLGTWDRGHLSIHKDLGLVSQALPADVIHGMQGTSGIAHVRYPTIGSGTRGDAQPFMTRRPSV